jgi:mannose-6-phosphate isomerase
MPSPGRNSLAMPPFGRAAICSCMNIAEVISSMDPLVFEPYLRPMVWGGRKLEELFCKRLSPEGNFGESWEISPHPHHVSRVAEGPRSGQTLEDLCREFPKELLGERTPPGTGFPLLIKILDCDQLLSIQVHPTDQLARRITGESLGKTEAWVILHAEPTAKVYAGFLPGVTRDEVMHRLAEGTLESALHGFTPQPGDCLFLPAGTVHAVGGGVVMAEVQQASDATFRLYDWNRPGPEGKPRRLHIQEALEAIDWNKGPVGPVTPNLVEGTAEGVLRERLVRCPYFELERATLAGGSLSEPMERALIWIVLEGTGELRVGENYRHVFHQGQTVLVPFSTRESTWSSPEEGSSLSLLRVSWY